MISGHDHEDILRGVQRLKPSRGGLVIGPRPGKRSKGSLRSLHLSHVCTLLSARENPDAVASIAQELGCRWIWLPMAGGQPSLLAKVDVPGLLGQFIAALADVAEPRVYLHCAAGIHRTGFFASILLRLEAVHDVAAALADLRPVTARQLGDERFALALAKAAELIEPGR
jgi:hypothetical protein